MKTFGSDTTTPTESSAWTKVLCFLIAIPLGLHSVIWTLVMLMASMNVHFSSPPQLGIFFAGWTFVGTSFVATYRLLKRQRFNSLWFLIPPILCLALVQWLGAFPQNRNLLH